MPKVLEENRQLVDVKTQEFQSSLAVRIQKFKDNLEIYAKFVNEMQYNGNIDDLPKYHKKATQLEERSGFLTRLQLLALLMMIL